MSTIKAPCKVVAPSGALARPGWEAGDTLTAGALALEQSYLVQRFRRHLRTVHTWGVICGLNVVPAPGLGGWNLFVCPGYGIGPCGDEIYLRRALAFDLRDYLWMEPVNAQSNRVWLSIEGEPVESTAEPQDANKCGGCGCGGVSDCGCGGNGGNSGCGCGGKQGEAKSERLSDGDGLRIVVSWSAPNMVRAQFDLCTGIFPCPPCPDACALPLASVSLPVLNALISAAEIQNFNLVERQKVEK